MVDVDLSVEIGGVRFRNPFMNGACDLTGSLKGVRSCVEGGIGGVVIKTLSTNPMERTRVRPYYFAFNRFGREMYRSWVTCESFGFMPPDKWLEGEGAQIVKFCHENDVPVICSIVGRDLEEAADLAAKVAAVGADMVEIPFASCPNIPYTQNPKIASEWMHAISKESGIPVICKPSIMSDLIVDICMEAERGGASAVTSCFSTTALVIDIEREEPFGVPADVAYQPGPVQRPIVLGLIARIMRNVKIPVIGGCGIVTWRDALEFIQLGCPTVQLGSASFFEGKQLWRDLTDGIASFMVRKGYSSVKEFQGKAFRKVKLLQELPVEPIYSHPSPITPVFDEKSCIYCVRCTNACVYDAIHVDAKKKTIQFNPNECRGCGLCVTICPLLAVKLVDKNGNVYWDGHGTAKLYDVLGESNTQS